MIENQLNRCNKVNEKWTNAEQNWTKTEQKLDKTWTKSEQKLDKTGQWPVNYNVCLNLSEKKWSKS